MEKERTLVLVKPDGVQRGLIGQVISRFEDAGLKIIGCKMTQINKAFAEKHYTEHKNKDFFPKLVNFITSGPVLAMVIEGNSAISKVRQLAGSTLPSEALPGTIRGDFAHLTQERGNQKEYGIPNLVHASDEKAGAAEREIALWFKPDEIYTYKRCDEEFTL